MSSLLPQKRSRRKIVALHGRIPIKSAVLHKSSRNFGDDDYKLQEADESTLNKLFKRDLELMCQKRGLSQHGTKGDLIQQLLDWEEQHLKGGHYRLLLKKTPTSSQKKDRDNDAISEFAAPSNIGKKLKEEERQVASEINQYLRDERSVGSMLVVSGSHAKEFEEKPKVKEKKKPSLAEIKDVFKNTTIIPYTSLIKGKKLGSGGFKVVYKGIFQGQEVAIGEMKVDELSRSELVDLQNEIKILSELHHEYIIEFVGLCLEPGHICIITELATHGDLYYFMCNTKRPAFQKQLNIMHDISSGLHYLHTRRPPLVHRDMKSLNVLIDKDYKAKINDFGLAKFRHKMFENMQTVVGTPYWQAPELWTSDPVYTEKIDVYACGLVFWEILQWSDKYPFCDKSQAAIYHDVGQKGERPSLKNVQSNPPELLELIQDMWAQHPDERPNMGSVIERLKPLYM